MANLKSLAKDTVIYGLSSIVGRFLNYLLMPLYTIKMAVASGGYGVVTNIYSWTALLMVLLIFGMETTCFRFANKEGADPRRVFSTALSTVGALSLLFMLLLLLFLQPAAGALGYAAHPQYVAVMGVVVAIDAIQALPFSYLRFQKRPIKFAAIKLFIILFSILLNLFVFLAVPRLKDTMPSLFGWYNPTDGPGYVFYINLVCSLVSSLLLWREMSLLRFGWNRALFGQMMRYSFPIMLLGVAGILNQTVDKILFPLLTHGDYPQLAIYGGASKVAMIIVMFTQAFRYAYEPFIFGKSGQSRKESDESCAAGMKFFVIFSLLAFLMVMFYMDIIQLIIAKDYREGLKVVPIIMVAEIFMGVYFNLSFWYKLTDDTKWGAIFSAIGCAVLVAVNVLFIPRCGYMACAWGGVAGYGTAMLLSYFMGQKRYPIAYDLRGIGAYVLLAAALYALSLAITPQNMWLRLGMNTLLLCVYMAYLLHKDLPLKQIPLLNRFFR